MSVFPLVIAPDARLKNKSSAVDKVDDVLRNFMDNLLRTMYATGGIGLAAVQVGVHKRVLVMDVSHGSSRYKESETGVYNPIFMVNPEIIEESGESNTYEEGCLSFPGQYAEVTRPKIVKVSYLDYNGNKQILEADGLLATCVQHEIDHLNGITFVDYLSRTKREIILKKLQKNADN